MITKNIWAVGRNYAEHAKELGNSVPTTPMIFLKAGTCISFDAKVQLPEWSEDIHHELEIALRWNEKLEFQEMTLALDLTERKLQNELKKQGHPWTLAKSFTNACPLSQKWIPFDPTETYSLELTKNETRVQKGSSSEMIHSISQLKKYVETHFPVTPGDLLLTGTPSGVGPLSVGDRLEAVLKNSLGVQILNETWTIHKGST